MQTVCVSFNKIRSLFLKSRDDLPGCASLVRCRQRIFLALEPTNVAFEGYVDDIVAEVGRAAVAVAPLRIGGGTRLKVLEAMALGRPVVATRIGAEGIEVKHDRDLLIADAPRDFADAVLRLLAQPAEAAAIGLRGRRRVGGGLRLGRFRGAARSTAETELAARK